MKLYWKTTTPIQFTKECFLPHVWKVKNPQSAGKYYICDWVEYSFCWLGIPHSRGKGAFTNYVDKILPIIAIYLYFWGNWFPEISENLISTDISNTTYLPTSSCQRSLRMPPKNSLFLERCVRKVLALIKFANELAFSRFVTFLTGNNEKFLCRYASTIILPTTTKNQHTVVKKGTNYQRMWAFIFFNYF